MTNQELLELVQTASPAELTLEQLQLLRERLGESAELQQIFSSRLKLQSYLVEAFSRLEEPIAALESTSSVRSANGNVSRWIAVPGLGFIVIVIAATWWANSRAPDGQQPDKSLPTPLLADTAGAEQQAEAEPDATRSRPHDVSQSATATADTQAATTATSGAAEKQTLTTASDDASVPWQRAFSAEAGPPLPFEQVCFEQFDPRRALPRRDDLERWFAPLAGARAEITEAQSGPGICGGIDGLFRLLAPWTEDSVLRFSLAGGSQLQIHCFRGARGVTLVNYGGTGGHWAAYVTSRRPEASTPASWALTATDGGRGIRTSIDSGGELALRYRAGEMILSRGDIVLLRAPLAGPPQHVYFQGNATFHGISLSRTHGIPYETHQLATVHPLDQPGEQLDWTRHPDAGGARVETLDKGALRFERVAGVAPQWILTKRLDCQGIVLEIDDVTPGAEICLVDNAGKRIATLRYTSDPSSGQLRLLGDQPAEDVQPDLGAGVVPCVAGRHWLRLVFGTSSVRWWLSADGQHWAEAAEPMDVQPGDVRQIGFCLSPVTEFCGITLRRVLQLKLPRLSSLATARWRTLAAALPAGDYESWRQDTAESCPKGCELAVWQRACALRALERGCQRALATRLLDRLLDDAAELMSLEQQRDLLTEAALLVDGRASPRLLERLLSRFHDLGRQAFEHEAKRPMSFVRQALMTAPLAPRDSRPVAPQELIRKELLQLVYSARWSDTLAFCRVLRFFHFDEQAPLFQWSAALASRADSTQFGGGMVRRQRESWRELLVLEVNREAYTAVTELQALLDSAAVEEASHMLTSMSATDARGMVSRADDPQLLVSLATGARLALEDHPSLIQRITQRAASAAELRVQQAIGGNDSETLRLATLQFTGTAAAEAHHWLGDRALACGSFAEAWFHYQQSVSLDSDPASDEITQKISLTAAASHRETPRLPPPAGYTVQSRRQLLGPVGRQSRQVNLDLSRFKVDAVGRQLAVTVDGDMMFLSNRFHVAALDASGGQLRWLSPPLTGTIGRVHDWPLTPMRPLVEADRVFVRLLYGDGPSLACLDRSSGQLLWTVPQRDGVYIVSDPFFQGRELTCLTLVQTAQDQWRLRRALIDPETGAVWREQELIGLRDHWHTRRVCQVITGPGSTLVTLGGVTLCYDASGNIRWLRRHLVVPADSEPQWVTQAMAPPSLAGDSVFLAQPGVRTVDCADAGTGRLRWRRILPGIRAIVGATDDRVVLHTDRGLTALNAATGETLWRHDVEDVLYVHPWPGSDLLLYSAQVNSNAGNPPRLIWLNVLDGSIDRFADLSSLDDAQPCIGPLVGSQDRVWLLFGRGRTNPQRELVELSSLGQTDE